MLSSRFQRRNSQPSGDSHRLDCIVGQVVESSGALRFHQWRGVRDVGLVHWLLEDLRYVFAFASAL